MLCKARYRIRPSTNLLSYGIKSRFGMCGLCFSSLFILANPARTGDQKKKVFMRVLKSDLAFFSYFKKYQGDKWNKNRSTKCTFVVPFILYPLLVIYELWLNFFLLFLFLFYFLSHDDVKTQKYLVWWNTIILTLKSIFYIIFHWLIDQK